MLELRSVSKRYKDGDIESIVLRDINLIINDNDFITIRGQSGGGKSTLLNIISLLNKPSTGEIYFDGKLVDLSNEKQIEMIRRDNIGLVFQSANLISCLNVLDNIMLPAYDKDKGKIKDKAKILLETIGLKEKYRANVKTLSGGEAQRVSIVRALINNPKYILCDEPTGALDQETGKKVIGLLKEIHEDKKCSLIIVTHDEKIAELGNRKLIVQGGKLIEVD